MKKVIIMSLVLNLILAILLLAPTVQGLKQVHVDTKKIYEHGLSSPMPDFNVEFTLFAPTIL